MMNIICYMIIMICMIMMINGDNVTYTRMNREAQILRKAGELKGDGSYHSVFETSNGIKRQDNITPEGHIVGSSSYTSPEGIEIKMSYVADETGYHPVGDHIPKVPDYIIRSLEYIRLHPYIEKDYYTGAFKTPKPPAIPTIPPSVYQKLHRTQQHHIR